MSCPTSVAPQPCPSPGTAARQGPAPYSLDMWQVHLSNYYCPKSEVPTLPLPMCCVSDIPRGSLLAVRSFSYKGCRVFCFFELCHPIISSCVVCIVISAFENVWFRNFVVRCWVCLRISFSILCFPVICPTSSSNFIFVFFLFQFSGHMLIVV